MVQLRQLGTSDLHITPIGFGSWAVGGSWAFGWGAQDDQESIGAIQQALDLGVNWIDTAAVYGLGHAEEVVAQAVQGRSQRPYIFTKCERVWNERGEVGGSLKADSIRREVENSLRRLHVDVIDLYQIHWPEPDEDIEEGWTTMAQLQAEGKVRYIGVSNFDVAQMQRAQRIAPITSLQPPYSLLHPETADELLPFCQQNSIGVIVYSPMRSGLLTGKMTPERVTALPDDDWRKRDRDFQPPKLARNLALAQFLGAVGQRHGRTAGEVAVAWTLSNPAVTGAIVGARHPHQAREAFGALDFRLTADEITEITQFQATRQPLP